MSADVAVLIVTYNSEQQISNCIRSVQVQRDHVRQQIIILDNDSTDATVATIRREFPDVQLIIAGKNLGFAAGVNEAARHADAAFLLLLNPDTEIVDHGVDVIVDFARQKPQYGLYGGRTLKADGSLESSSCWGRPTLWSMGLFAFGLTTLFPRNAFFDPESLGSWQRDTIREVGVITGCFLLIGKDAWERLGGFDERYFMYGEDVDLAIRAHAAGYRPVICPEAKLRHDVGQSSATPIAKMLLLFRGKASLVRAHWKGLAQQLGLILLATGVGMRALIGRIEVIIRPQPAGELWFTLWRARGEWLRGYAPVPVAARRSGKEPGIITPLVKDLQNG